MFTVSSTSWPEVVLGVVFVILAVAVFLGTFYLGGSYVFSNIKERWHDYSPAKRIKVLLRLVVSFGVLALLLYLSARRLH